MSALLIKIAITVLPVAAIGELGRRSTFAGALPASLALISLLATVRLYGTGDAMQAATLASALFWLALPSSSRLASVRDETFWLHWQPGSVRRPSRTERANWPTASSR